MAPGNNRRIRVVPKSMFLILESQTTTGIIHNYTSVSNEGATIDFSSGEEQSKNYASVVQRNHRQLEVSYPSARERL